MFLEEMADVIIGLVLKRKEALYKNETTFSYKLFNLRNYDENIEFEEFLSNEKLDDFVLKQGDLILRLSYPLKIIEVDEELEGCIVNNQYCIIRVKNEFNSLYDIGFIRCFFESKNAKEQFEKNLIGTTVKSIPVVKLRMLKLPLVNKDKQEKLSNLIKNWNNQKKLYKKIIKEKDIYYNSIVEREIEKEMKENE